MYCEKCGTKLVDDKCPNCSPVEKKKEEPVANYYVPKKKSKKGLIIFLIIFFIVLAVGIGLLLFFLLGNNGDPITKDTWEVTYQYSDKSKIISKIKFNNDKTFEFTATNDSSSRKETVTGTWKKDGDKKYILTVKNNGDSNDVEVYMVDDDTICFNKENCERKDKYFRSSSNLNKVIKEEDTYSDDDDDDDYDYDDDDDYDDDIDSDSDYTNAKPDTKGNWSFQMTYDKKKDSDKVVINIFYGEGCSHCKELFEFLDGLDKATKEKFVVQKYEVWYDNDNADLMQECADLRDEDATGVPYILISDKSWNGFSENYKDEMLKLINAGTSGSYYNYVEWVLE